MTSVYDITQDFAGSVQPQTCHASGDVTFSGVLSNMTITKPFVSVNRRISNTNDRQT